MPIAVPTLLPTIVIPFAGTAGKTRLRTSRRARRELSLAMLGDVLAAALAVGETVVVTADGEGAELAREAGAGAVADPGGGQGVAVEAALAELRAGPVLIVNADLPCATPDDLRRLLAGAPAGGIALVEAADGTTNALALPSPAGFVPCYGAGSAARFKRAAAERGLPVAVLILPNLVDDVDTPADLERLRLRCGPRTRDCLVELTATASA